MDKPSKKFYKQWWFWTIIVVIIIIVISGSSGSGGTDQTTPVATAQSQGVCATSLKDLKAKATSVSYKNLSKDPNSFNGTVTTFTGKVLQIQQDGDTGVIRLSVTNEGYGIWSPNDVLYITYTQATPAVEGDIVTVTGTLTGSYTYTSQANYQITLPSMDTCGSDVEESAAHSTASTSAKVSAAPSDSAPVSQPVTPNVPIVPATPAAWHVAYRDADSVGSQTPPFALKGTQQRIDYSCSVLDTSNSSESYFQGVISATQGFDENSFANMVTCPTTNSSYEYSLSPGQYYLALGPINARYEVTVYDYY